MIIQFLWGYYARLSAQPRMKTYFWTCVGPGSGCSGPICQNNCDQRETVQDTIRWLGYHHSALKYTQCLHFLKLPGYFIFSMCFKFKRCYCVQFTCRPTNKSPPRCDFSGKKCGKFILVSVTCWSVFRVNR